MRIYVSADIEGVSGAVAAESGRPGGHDYEEYRSAMTRMVVTACETAHELGVSELVVSDSHGNGQNIRPQALPEYVHLVRSWPRPLGMMQGVEIGKFAGAFLLGYHTGAANPDGNLAHTLTGEFAEVVLGGRQVSEADISALIAAHYDVPILLFAGDDAAAREAERSLGVATVALKHAYGYSSAISPSFAVMEERIRDGVRRALGAPRRPITWTIDYPLMLELRFRNRLKAELFAYLDGIERGGAYAIKKSFNDAISLSKFLIFAASISVKNG